MWVRMMRKAPAPLARAASTKSIARTCVVTDSVTRVIGGMKTMVMARSALPTPAPSEPAMATASRIEGKAYNTSVSRMTSILVRPPIKPATRPSVPPIASATATGSTPMVRDRRPPWIRRESMSRPSSSVPRRWPDEPTGSRRCAALVAAGSGSPSHGASTAAPVIASRMKAQAAV